MAEKVTESNYQDFTSSGIVLLDIKAEWCGPCKVLSPIIDQLSEELTNIKIGKMDADESRDTCQQLGIRSIPTIIIFKDGQIVEKHTGMIQKPQLVSLLEKHSN